MSKEIIFFNKKKWERREMGLVGATQGNQKLLEMIKSLLLVVGLEVSLGHLPKLKHSLGALLGVGIILVSQHKIPGRD